jgi:hypothetical protein
MLDGFVSEIEDDGGESAGLEEQIRGANCLVEARPGLRLFLE